MRDIDSDSELKERVEERIGPVFEGHWRTVCANRHEPYDNADVDEAVKCVRELRRMEESLEPSSSEELQTTLVGRQVGLDALVNDLRAKLFGSSDPPFASSAEAGAWIRDTVREETGIQLAPTESRKTREFAWATASWDRGARITDSDERFPTASGGKLSEIADLSSTIAHRLRCSPGQAARLILLGDIPKASPVIVRTLFGEQPALVITIRSPSVTAKELVNRYKDLRERLWASRRAPPDPPVDLKLVELCMNMPDATWEKRHRAWNSQYPGDSFEKLGSFQKRCNRSLSKWERLRKR